MKVFEDAESSADRIQDDGAGSAISSRTSTARHRCLPDVSRQYHAGAAVVLGVRRCVAFDAEFLRVAVAQR